MPDANFIRRVLADMFRNDVEMTRYMEKFEKSIRPYNLDGLDAVQVTNVLLARDNRRDIKHWWGNTESYAMLTQTRALEIIAMWAAEQLLQREAPQKEVRSEGLVSTSRPRR